MCLLFPARLKEWMNSRVLKVGKCLFANQPSYMMERRGQRKRQTTSDWQVTVLTSKGTYIRGLSWAATVLKVYIEALVGFSHIYRPDGLNNTLLFQGYVFETGSYCGNSGQNVHSKDGKEMRSFQLPTSSSLVQGQLVVMSS